MGNTAISAAAAINRGTERPPILQSTRALGLTDTSVAKLLGITPEAITSWITGRKNIPPVRHVALIFLVSRLTGEVGFVPASRYARRSELIISHAASWNRLAKQELNEAMGGDIYASNPAIVSAGFKMGQLALDRLEKADAS